MEVASGSKVVAHFGLGDLRRTDSLKVIWPSGDVSEFREIPGGRRIVITEGEDNYEVEKN